MLMVCMCAQENDTLLPVHVLLISRTTRFATFPDYLMVQLSKFTLGDDWVPKKYGESTFPFSSFFFLFPSLPLSIFLFIHSPPLHTHIHT